MEFSCRESSVIFTIEKAVNIHYQICVSGEVNMIFTGDFFLVFETCFNKIDFNYSISGDLETPSKKIETNIGKITEFM